MSFRVYTEHLLIVCGLITVYCSVHLTLHFMQLYAVKQYLVVKKKLFS